MTEETTETTTTETTEETVETTETESTTDTGDESTEETVVKKTEEDNTTEEDETTDEQETETPVERVVPKSNDYAFPENTPEQLQTLIGEFASKNDMTQEQLGAAMSFNAEIVSKADEYQRVQVKATGEALMKEWGDTAADNLALAQEAMNHYDKSGELKKLLATTGYGNSGAVLSLFHGIGKDLQEGGFIESKAASTKDKRTLAEKMFPNFSS